MERPDVGRAVAEERDGDAGPLRSLKASAAPTMAGSPPPTTAFAPRLPRSTSYRCIEPPYPWLQPSTLPYSSAMTSFGCVPLASVWPCARWVEAITSPSSSAANSDGDGLLTDGYMEEAGQLTGAKTLLHLLLETADEEHLAQEILEPVGRSRLPGVPPAWPPAES